jgi:MFS family permease
VRLLGVASLVNDISGELVFPLIPAFIKSLGAGPLALGAVEGVADTTASIVKLWSGGVSDRAGKRKPFIVAGYALAALARPVAGVATMPWQVLLVRAADRFGKGVRSAPKDALIADSTSVELRGRAYGFTRAMDHLGAAIGPAIAFAFLWQWPEKLRLLFLLTAVPGLLVVLLLIRGLRERPIHTPAGKRFQLSLRPFDRNFRIYLVALACFTLGNATDAFLLLRAGELGVSAPMIPLLWGAFSLVKSAGSPLAGRMVDRIGPRPLIAAGWILYAATYLAFAWATTVVQVWAVFLVYGLFHALTEPAERTLVANLVSADRQGLAFGWFNFAIGIVALPSSVVFGWIYAHYGAEPAFVWSAALAVLAVLVLGLVQNPSKACAAA